MKVIELTKGHVAIVDDEDFEHLAQYRWHFHSGGYATRKIKVKGKTISIYMHRQILGAECEGKHVDHRNRNGLDNRRCNLRTATSAQNNANQSMKSNNSSGFRGVHYSKFAQKFTAKISHQGKAQHLGYFKTAEEAALAYNAAALLFHGELANLN